MKKYHLPNDIIVFCTTVKSFPDGIQEAFMTLDQMLSKEGRTFYGISYFNEAGAIVYKAAVTENFAGESETYGFEKFVIRKGEYLTETVSDWMKQTSKIGEAFKRLLADPEYDAAWPCVEWYMSDKEVMCMVRNKAQ